MHILVIEQRYTGLEEAGIGRFALFAREWIKKGHTVTVIAGMVNYISGEKPSHCRGKLVVKECEENGVVVFRVFDAGIGYRTFFGRLFSYGVFLMSAFLVGFFVRRPHAIIASSPPIFVGLVGWFLSSLKRSRFIFEVRDLWPDEAVELGFLKNKFLIAMSQWLEQFLYRRARTIIVNSPGIKEFLTMKKFVPEAKVAVVTNPIDVSGFHRDESLRSRLGWQDKFVFIYSGSMSAVYDFDIVLQAARHFKKELMLFVFVGDGRKKAGLMKKVSQENLQNVIFLPPVPKEKVLDFVGAADVGMATLEPGMQLLRYVYATKIFDYMAAAKPILLAMRGVSADLVCKEARCGLCVQPGDVAGFIAALARLHQNRALQEEMGSRGLEYLKKNFDPASLARTYLETLTK